MTVSTPEPRTREELIAAIDAGWAPKWVFFWGHTPSKDGSISKSCFSQWWEGHPFAIDGVTYRTAEHYMMAEKARLFGDEAVRGQILAARTPGEAKKLGRMAANFDEDTWLRHRWDIVVAGSVAKFGQHEALRRYLFETGKKVLVEASPTDRIWGIGMAANDPDAENAAAWRGLNLLGFALMEARQRVC